MSCRRLRLMIRTSLEQDLINTVFLELKDNNQLTNTSNRSSLTILLMVLILDLSLTNYAVTTLINKFDQAILVLSFDSDFKNRTTSPTFNCSSFLNHLVILINSGT